MDKLFGISNYSAVECNESIETVASKNEFVIRRVKDVDNGDNWHYDYIILNKNLEPDCITRNEWSLNRFHSFSQWYPTQIPVGFKDPINHTPQDFSFNLKNSKNSQSFLSVDGLGPSGLTSMLELFFNASNHNNWLEYLRSRPEITLYNEGPSLDLQKKEDFFTLKEDVKRLREENEELKEFYEKIKNHLLYKLFLKWFMKIK